MTELSPAAQAVLNAANGASSYGSDDCLNDARQIAVATIRAVADLLSKEVDASKVDGSKYAGLWHSVDYLLAIADELEAQ
jgi:hypothetical protein